MRPAMTTTTTTTPTPTMSKLNSIQSAFFGTWPICIYAWLAGWLQSRHIESVFVASSGADGGMNALVSVCERRHTHTSSSVKWSCTAWANKHKRKCATYTCIRCTQTTHKACVLLMCVPLCTCTRSWACCRMHANGTKALLPFVSICWLSRQQTELCEIKSRIEGKWKIENDPTAAAAAHIHTGGILTI